MAFALLCLFTIFYPSKYSIWDQITQITSFYPLYFLPLLLCFPTSPLAFSTSALPYAKRSQFLISLYDLTSNVCVPLHYLGLAYVARGLWYDFESYTTAQLGAATVNLYSILALCIANYVVVRLDSREVRGYWNGGKAFWKGVLGGVGYAGLQYWAVREEEAWEEWKGRGN